MLYLKGTRIVMFQLSGFYYKPLDPCNAMSFFVVQGMGNLSFGSGFWNLGFGVP